MIAVSVRPDAGGIPAPRKLRVTQKRIDANRRNAARSTGPRTREGKARVRLNAIRHGLRSRDDTFLSFAGDSAINEIADLFTLMCEGFLPTGPEQGALVYRMAYAAWKERRAFELGEREGCWEAPYRPWAERDRLVKLANALTAYESKAAHEFDRAFNALLDLQYPSQHENRRTNPLARRSRASGPEPGEGPQPYFRSAAQIGLSKQVENRRTNPLARELAPYPLNNSPSLCGIHATIMEQGLEKWLARMAPSG